MRSLVILNISTFMFQVPRPLMESDLEKALATSRKTNVAAGEYSGLNLQTPRWTGHRESGDYQFQAAINELSKIVVSQIINLQTDTQDP